MFLTAIRVHSTDLFNGVSSLIFSAISDTCCDATLPTEVDIQRICTQHYAPAYSKSEPRYVFLTAIRVHSTDLFNGVSSLIFSAISDTCCDATLPTEVDIQRICTQHYAPAYSKSEPRYVFLTAIRVHSTDLFNGVAS